MIHPDDIEMRKRAHEKALQTGKLEYQYFNFGNSQFVAGPPALVGLGSFRSDEHTFKAGLNYRFNLGGPVVARYWTLKNDFSS